MTQAETRLDGLAAHVMSAQHLAHTAPVWDESDKSSGAVVDGDTLSPVTRARYIFDHTP
ncbi:MAG: hypothetical protein HKN25_04065 [Pyrinomonadaceae bacterium]|nr:hypothetical protein [Pyrinomonadaceae bacterium]